MCATAARPPVLRIPLQALRSGGRKSPPPQAHGFAEAVSRTYPQSPAQRAKTKAGPGFPGPASVRPAWAVSRILSRSRGGGHFSCDAVADAVEAVHPSPSDRTSRRAETRGDCLTLHAVGFAMPRLSPDERCALTAPFHPCLCPPSGEPSAVCFLRHFPSPRPGERVGVAHHRVLPCSDFPPAQGLLPAPAAARPRNPMVRIHRPPRSLPLQVGRASLPA